MQQMNPISKIIDVYHKMLGEELLQNQPTTKVNQFSQRTTATIRSTGEHSYDSTSNQKLIPHRSSIAAQQGSRAGVTVLAPEFVTERNRRQLLKCKRTINLSTFNVRTLQSIKQMSELIAIAVTYHIDVINVQEHRFYHEDIDLKYHELGNGQIFISASALKNIGNSTIGRVGMLLSPLATKSLNSIEKIT